MNTKLSERIIEVRKKLKLSQAKFGALGNVQRGAQANYESGERKADTDYLESLIANNIDVSYIVFGHTGSAEQPSEDFHLAEKLATYETLPSKDSVQFISVKKGTSEAQWLEYFRNMSEEDRALIEPTVKGFAERGQNKEQKTG